jgi:hypothetical protein
MRRFMWYVMVAFVLGGVMSGCTRPAPVQERPVQDAHYQKEMEEIKKSMRGDIKIRLKRDGKGAYSWEVSGKDAYEIVKTNSILSKKINSDQREQDR